jgi:SAM-dependent methyltransferase
MNQRIKTLLQKLDLYHPLQAAYRGAISVVTNQYYKRNYRSYKGRGFTCNFCGVAYERFVPEHPGHDIEAAIYGNNVIAGFGENVYCPNCMSKNRDRLVKAVIENYLPATAKKVLHFSPEKQLFRFLIEAGHDVTTVDITPGFYRNIDDKVRYADATSLPFPDKDFDLLIANHILEHIPEDRTAMKEMHRVLKEDGYAILQVPYSQTLAATIEEPGINDPARQAALYGQRDHVRIYAFADYQQRLVSAGFKVRVLDPEELARFRIYAIQPNESVVLASKIL